MVSDNTSHLIGLWGFNKTVMWTTWQGANADACSYYVGILPTVISKTFLGGQASFLGISDSWQLQAGPGSLTEFGFFLTPGRWPVLFPPSFRTAVWNCLLQASGRHSTAQMLKKEGSVLLSLSSPECRGPWRWAMRILFSLWYSFIYSFMNEWICKHLYRLPGKPELGNMEIAELC